MHQKVLITDYGFSNIEPETSIVSAAGYTLATAQCKTAEEVIAAGRDADALLVQWAPVNAAVIEQLTNCKVIVRYGIGVDNVDLKAAAARGIAVCNVPQYCTHEVADHTLALALSLGRQLTATRTQMNTQWKITPPAAMPAFRQMRFVTLGLGRIARAVMQRAAGFQFALCAYDPFVDETAMAHAGIQKLSLDEAFATADILSLHLPLNEETKHIVNAVTLAKMKSSSILVNTSRGGLIDTMALCEALHQGVIAGAGLDVFEREPLETDHPLRSNPRAVLTSHTAWFSEASVPALQRMAAEEIVRGLQGAPLLNRIN